MCACVVRAICLFDIDIDINNKGDCREVSRALFRRSHAGQPLDTREHEVSYGTSREMPNGIQDELVEYRLYPRRWGCRNWA